MNKKMTKANTYKMRKQIYEQVMSNVLTQLNENEVNELFNWGNGVEKPSQAITADFVKSASEEELANNIASWLNYWADSAKDGLDKALSAAIMPCMEVCQAGEEHAKKFLNGLMTSIKSGLTGASEKIASSAKALPRLIVMGIALCIKLAAQGVTGAKALALNLYQGVIKFAKSTYAACVDKVEKGVDTIKEKLDLLCKLSLAVFTLVANKVTGAAEVCSAWIKEIVAAAKEKTTLAVLMVRSWFALKFNEAKEYITTLGEDLKSKVVEAYNALDKAIRKAWNKIAEKIIEWCDAVRITAGKLADKVKETMTAAGDAIISAKDKTVVAGIGKAVKLLSKNYSEDDVVALVRKAYNEGLTFCADGTCVINESYYSNTHLSRV